MQRERFCEAGAGGLSEGKKIGGAWQGREGTHVVQEAGLRAARQAPVG